MKKLLVIVLPLLAACVSGQGSSDTDNLTEKHADIVVSARTDRTAAALDETIRFTLIASCPRHVQLNMPEIGSLIAGLRIVDFGENGPDLVDDRLLFEKWFDLQADFSGTYIIPSMTVRAANSGETREISTPQIFIKVGGPAVSSDNTTIRDIIDIKPLVVLPRDFKPLVLFSVIVIVLIGAAVSVWLYVRKRRAAVAPPPKPAHVLAYEQLEQLANEGLVEKGIVQAYYVRLSDIFRHYLQNRFIISAVEHTTQELLRSIAGLADMTPVAKKLTREFLLQADLVKFAKYRPEKSVVQQSQQQVRDIIGLTLPGLQGDQEQTSAHGTRGKDERQ